MTKRTKILTALAIALAALAIPPFHQTPPARAEDPGRSTIGGNGPLKDELDPQTRAAVDKGLTWLAQQVQATTTHKITCRYNPAIQPTGRLKHPDGRIFNIEGVMDLEDRHVHMVLTCTQKAS